TGAAHFADVTFTWSPLAHPGPPMVSWREGHEDVLDVRLTAIETSTHGLRARRYDFSYEEVDVTADLHLVGVTLTAFADNPADDVQLPSTVFVYARTLFGGWAATGATSFAPDSFEVPNVGAIRFETGNITSDNVDIDGDSVVDRIESSSQTPQVNQGNGRGFEPKRAWNWPTAPGSPRAVRKTNDDGNMLNNLIDLDGDGFPDLVDSNASTCSLPNGNWCMWRGGADGFA